MSRILSLCSRIPYPLTDGAKLRLFYTARELARKHDVELLVLDRGSVEQSAVEALENVFEAVHVFTYPRFRFYLNTLPGLVSRKPLQTHYYYFSDVKDWLDRNRHRFDLFYCNHARTTEYVRGYDLPKVVDLVDAISRNYKHASQDTAVFWRLVYQIEWRRLRRYERLISRAFDHAFIITDADRQFVTDGESFPSFSVLPNGVKPALLDRETHGHRSILSDPKIAFLGKMNYFPNEDSVKRFTTKIFPHVRSKYPQAEFLVVGASPSDRVQNLGDEPGVTVTGFVDDPYEYLLNADIVVAPMKHGAGLQNKVLEAMALGRPVVATPLACEGIKATDGKHFLVAHQGEFSETVNNLISDAKRRRLLGDAARSLIEDKYTWENIGEDLRGVVSDVINKT